MEDKYTPLQIGNIAFFMPWKDIIITDEIIDVHPSKFKDKSGYIKKVTLYEFKHIQGKYRAYKTKEEIEGALGL